PGGAAVVGAVEAALLGFNEGVDAARVGRGDGDTDLAPGARRQAVVLGLVLQVLPTVAAVAGDVQAAAGAAGGHLPRLAAGLPQPGEEEARVVRVQADVAGAGVGVLLEHLLPRLAAVGGAVDAALRVGAEGVAQDRRVGDVRVGG